MSTVAKGKLGEDTACKFLKNIGYKILERNFRIRGGEIDIIAIDGNILVYVEVKTRSSNNFGTPEEAITPYKLKFLVRSAKFYRNNRRNRNLPDAERIDVVTVDMSQPEPKLRHIKNITL